MSLFGLNLKKLVGDFIEIVSFFYYLKFQTDEKQNEEYRKLFSNELEDRRTVI